MFAFPVPRRSPEDIAMLKRVAELERCGYIECVNQKWQLTEKGWRTLSAAADTRVKPVKATKNYYESELKTAHLMLLQGGKFLV